MALGCFLEHSFFKIGTESSIYLFNGIDELCICCYKKNEGSNLNFSIRLMRFAIENSENHGIIGGPESGTDFSLHARSCIGPRLACGVEPSTNYLVPIPRRLSAAYVT